MKKYYYWLMTNNNTHSLYTLYCWFISVYDSKVINTMIYIDGSDGYMDIELLNKFRTCYRRGSKYCC